MRLIDADALRERMYHDAFEVDSDMQRWDSGCWIRYKMFENAIDDAPTIEPNLQPTCNQLATDCISRQAAIDFIDAGHLVNPNEPRWSDNEVVNFLKSRPSAQRTGRWKSMSDDLISKKAAIDATWFEPSYTDPLNVLTEVRDRLETLPSAQRTGRWKVTPLYIKCSECGESFMLIPQNYCPNCGARMEVEE